MQNLSPYSSYPQKLLLLVRMHSYNKSYHYYNVSETVLGVTYTNSFNPPNSIIRKVILMFSFIDEETEAQSLAANTW